MAACRCLVAVLTVISLVVADKEYNFNVQRVPSNPDGYPMVVTRISHTDHRFDDPTHRAFPGPMIRVKKGEMITVKLTNKYEDKTTSMHFHGIHQMRNPWMDGAQGVTQCAIPPGGKFTYRFEATHTGTYWYHSHTAHQYTAGHLGPLIIDYPDNEVDPVLQRYPYNNDSDHVIMLQDWFHESEEDLFTNYAGPYNSFKGLGRIVKRSDWNTRPPYTPNYPWQPSSVLMNGRGRFDCQAVNNSCVHYHGGPCSAKTQCVTERDPFYGKCLTDAHPLDEFTCSGEYTRLRFINAAANAPLKVWIDRHDMIVVARDGVETEPKTVKFLLMGVGIRFDVMVRCSEPVGKYRIFTTVSLVFLPAGSNNPPIKTWTSALLSYKGATEAIEPLYWPFDPADNLGEGTETFEYQFAPLVPRMAPAAVRRIVLQYGDAYSGDPGEPLEEWIMNNITHLMPTEPVLQAVYEGKFPNSTVHTMPNGPDHNIRTTHMLHFEYGATYEFVVVGMNGQQHPWHLHGYTVEFLAGGNLASGPDNFVLNGEDYCGYPKVRSIRQDVLDSLGPKTDEPALAIARGDSFTVPRWGYSIFRVTMNNQGPWVFHCHVSWHHGMGMAMIWSVEKDGMYPDIMEPPTDFPAFTLLSHIRAAQKKDPPSSAAFVFSGFHLLYLIALSLACVMNLRLF